MAGDAGGNSPPRFEQPLPDIARDELDSLLEFNSSQGGTLSAVIGEYGAGRTHFLRQLASELELRARAREATPDKAQAARLKVSLIQCPPGGFEVLLGAIAEAIGLERMATRAQVVETLSDQPRVVLLDDIHRLVRPAIGGLRGLDQFAEFAREVDDGRRAGCDDRQPHLAGRAASADADRVEQVELGCRGRHRGCGGQHTGRL